jgi:hypothetical protein
MDVRFAVFNGHVNNAFERTRTALEECAPKWMARVDELDKEGDGIMHIFNVEIEPATAAYAAVVAFIVNGHAGPASDDKSDDPALGLVECQHCGWTGTEDDMPRQLAEVPDLLERVAPGEIVPAGECPECGCLCHPVANAATGWVSPGGRR